MTQEGFVPSVDGAPIYYRQMGADVGPTLVFCDGVGCAGYAWRYVIEQFRERHRLVHFHYRGHGLSAPPRDLNRLEIADHAQDALRVLDHLGIEDAVLVGHSMGVQVLLEIYRAAPSRVRALVPMCGSYGHVLDTFHGSALARTVFPFILDIATSRLALPFLQALWTTTLPTSLAYTLAEATEVNPKLVKQEDFFPYLQHMAEMDLEVFLRCVGAAARHSAEDLLPRVHVPALIVAAERDGFTPAWLSQKMCDLIPGAELLFVPTATHTAPIELPEHIVLRMCKFFEERLLPEPVRVVAAAR